MRKLTLRNYVSNRGFNWQRKYDYLEVVFNELMLISSYVDDFFGSSIEEVIASISQEFGLRWSNGLSDFTASNTYSVTDGCTSDLVTKGQEGIWFEYRTTIKMSDDIEYIPSAFYNVTSVSKGRHGMVTSFEDSLIRIAVWKAIWDRNERILRVCEDSKHTLKIRTKLLTYLLSNYDYSKDIVKIFGKKVASYATIPFSKQNVLVIDADQKPIYDGWIRIHQNKTVEFLYEIPKLSNLI